MIIEKSVSSNMNLCAPRADSKRFLVRMSTLFLVLDSKIQSNDDPYGRIGNTTPAEHAVTAMKPSDATKHKGMDILRECCFKKFQCRAFCATGF